jgi:hypothetical protein
LPAAAAAKIEHLRVAACVAEEGEPMKIEAMLWMMVLVSVAIAIVSPKYRAYSLTAVGVVIVAIVSIVVVTKQGKPLTSALPGLATQPGMQQSQHVDFEQFHIENLDKEDPEAKNRIAVAEIRFEQIRSEVGSQAGTIESIHARLYNDSARFTLTDYAYYLVVQDCIKTVCTTIYDQRGLAAALVPPNQARDIVIAIRDGDAHGVPTFKVLGTPDVKLTPTDTRAR